MLSDSRIVLIEKSPNKFWYGDPVDFHTVIERIEENDCVYGTLPTII